MSCNGPHSYYRIRDLNADIVSIEYLMDGYQISDTISIDKKYTDVDGVAGYTIVDMLF